MDVVTKSAEAQVLPVESETPNGEFEVVLSTEALDRDGEHLWIDEWKQPLPDRIHIDGDHGRSIEKTVGSAVPRIDGNQIVAKGAYAGTPYAQMVRQLVAEGHIGHLSVTYGESKNQKDGKPQRELWNAAFVAMPANPEAVVLSSKAAKVDEEAASPAVTHDTMVQAIHDAATHLGAQCANAADPGADEGANKGVLFVTHKDGFKYVKVLDWAGDEVATLTDKSSSSKDAGSPQESPEESPAEAATKAAALEAPAEVPAQAAEESADDVAKAKVAAKTRAHAFLISKNTHP